MISRLPKKDAQLEMPKRASLRRLASFDSSGQPDGEAKKSANRNSRHKGDHRVSDTRVVGGNGNVFIDLGFDEAEAHVMALRVQLMTRLRERLQEKGYTQVEAAKRLGMTQPRVSALLKGACKDFSMDMLLTLATRMGLKPELHLAAEP